MDPEILKRIQKESLFLLNKYPDHVLVVVHTKHKNTVKLDKIKYLLNSSITLNDFLNTLKQRIKLDKNHVIYFKINDKTIDKNEMTIPIEQIYNKYVNEMYKKELINNKCNKCDIITCNVPSHIDNIELKNFIVIEICRYTKYLNKTLSLLTMNLL
jgi:hypothetical protein